MLKSIILWEVLENQLTNTSGLKLRDFATYYNMKIMISFYKHKKYAYINTWPAHNFKIVILQAGGYQNYT
jgi:hypothetical protein